ncbi:MAG: hypothetical protein LBF79_01340 [Dysgonamonadaceae bacterium]|jgi:hypothetical protein|nr:hypothetical protein [Dysgonamonadaceae bacterium]
MFSKFSKEQLEMLVLYTTGINTILLEALLSGKEPNEQDEEQEIDLEIHIVERGREPEPGRTTKKE